jgi:hypothetical protein
VYALPSIGPASPQPAYRIAGNPPDSNHGFVAQIIQYRGSHSMNSGARDPIQGVQPLAINANSTNPPGARRHPRSHADA